MDGYAVIWEDCIGTMPDLLQRKDNSTIRFRVKARILPKEDARFACSRDHRSMLKQTVGQSMIDHQTNRERDILYHMAAQLTQAVTPEEWLTASSSYGFQRGAKAAVFSWVECDTKGLPCTIRVGGWAGHPSPDAPPVGAQLMIDSIWNNAQSMFGERNAPTFVSDVLTSPHVPETA